MGGLRIVLPRKYFGDEVHVGVVMWWGKAPVLANSLEGTQCNRCFETPVPSATSSHRLAAAEQLHVKEP